MCCVQDKVDNLLQNYYAALESESCMDRWAALYLLYIYIIYSISTCPGESPHPDRRGADRQEQDPAQLRHHLSRHDLPQLQLVRLRGHDHVGDLLTS